MGPHIEASPTRLVAPHKDLVLMISIYVQRRFERFMRFFPTKFSHDISQERLHNVCSLESHNVDS